MKKDLPLLFHFERLINLGNFISDGFLKYYSKVFITSFRHKPLYLLLVLIDLLFLQMYFAYYKIFDCLCLWTNNEKLLVGFCMYVQWKDKVMFCKFQGFRIAQQYDSYPWTRCSAFEATKKNCPRGEACLKLKNFKSYAWNWAMRCKLHSSDLSELDNGKG